MQHGKLSIGDRLLIADLPDDWFDPLTVTGQNVKPRYVVSRCKKLFLLGVLASRYLEPPEDRTEYKLIHPVDG